MASTFIFEVTVTVERESGKFASREEIAEQLQSAIEEANPYTVEGIGSDGDSTYNVDSWDIEEAPKRKRASKG